MQEPGVSRGGAELQDYEGFPLCAGAESSITKSDVHNQFKHS